MQPPWYTDDAVQVWHGDCLDVLADMADNTVDAVVTDPPYGLEFMGKDWDRPWAVGMSAPGYTDAERMARPSFGDSRNANCRACGGRQRGARRCTCETPQWDRHPREDMLAYQQWCQQWAEQCLRILKPGGHLLAFGGTRTHHRLATAIEDAGFEIRDSIAWLYGSGFPKSLDVGKAIDRRRDDNANVARVAAWLADQATVAGITRAQVDAHMGTSDMAGWWLSRLSHRAQVPQWEQWQRLRELIGFGDEMDAEVWRLNGRKGTPGEAWEQREVIDHSDSGRRVQSSWNPDGTASGVFRINQDGFDVTAPATEDARRWNGWGTALKPAHEPVVVARKPLVGTVAANVLTWGTGALNIDAGRVGTDERTYGMSGAPGGNGIRLHGGDGRDAENARRYAAESKAKPDVSVAGRWPPNVALDPHTAAELDQSTGDGLSRFFPVFKYEPKAPTLERPRMPRAGDDGHVIARIVKQCVTCGSKTIAPGAGGSPACGHDTWEFVRSESPADFAAHPTVKPLDLMRWLVRLVTPPGGVVLDPFLGSGTTAEACIVEGFRCIGVEREDAYLPMIRARLTKPIQPVLDLGGPT